MKTKIIKNIILILISIFVFSISGYSQEFVTVSELPDGKQWQIIEKAIYERGYKIGKFNPAENTLLTNWIQWKPLMVENRAIIKIELSRQDATISMVQRSYKTEDGWVNVMSELSIKNKKKYLQCLADKIEAINNDEKLIEEAVLNSILIRIFKPIIVNNGLELHFDTLTTHKKGLLLICSIKNISSETIKAQTVGTIITIEEKPKRKICGYVAPSFKKIAYGLGNRISTYTLKENETVKYYIYMTDFGGKIPENKVHCLKLHLKVNDKSTIFYNYNIPIINFKMV
ncbi:MAG: hypothetical protein KAT33_09115 [Bacteroidales bacterium]|nr:hypothetical protein [Bacteroidales bacterium]